MKLTDISCKYAKPSEKSRKLSDGAGLYLEVMPNGSKYWRLKYRFAGKEKRLALGVYGDYPKISLKEAREKRDKARKLVQEGIDPSQAKKDLKHQQYIDTENTLRNIACEWHQNQKLSWSEKHSETILRRLEVNIFPALGGKPIHTIKAQELLATLRVIESRDALDIAHRTLQTCSQIFRYAIATGRAERDISADLRGALKTRKKENYNRLEAKELPEFLRKLEEYDGDLQTILGFKLLILTFVRTGELRGARWEEFDFEKAEWRIPAERMKMKELHIVPLSKQSIVILKELQAINGSREYLLPNRNKPSTFISENTLLYAVYRMGYHGRATPHGFRGTASTILNEQGFRSDVIERQLAHGERNKVRASYNHAQYLPERLQMMQWWADYLDEINTHKI